ncbi:MAG: hypothetical protein Q9213_006794 [Squamulea squamosa]
MRFSTTSLALALSLASGGFARPQQYEQPTISGQDGYVAPTTSHHTFGSNPTTIPEPCMMFMPYVPPVFFGEVCSLHMTPLAPGSMLNIPTSCFSGALGIPTVRRQNSFTLGEPKTTQRSGGNEQPTTSQQGGENEQPTTSHRGGGNEQPTTSSRGAGNEQPTTVDEPMTTKSGYGDPPMTTAVSDGNEGQ